ncbi:hypothetical protein ACFXTI_045259 [Malus domestica]
MLLAEKKVLGQQIGAARLHSFLGFLPWWWCRNAGERRVSQRFVAVGGGKAADPPYFFVFPFKEEEK